LGGSACDDIGSVPILADGNAHDDPPQQTTVAS
jgi:hypothetical protein